MSDILEAKIGAIEQYVGLGWSVMLGSTSDPGRDKDPEYNYKKSPRGKWLQQQRSCQPADLLTRLLTAHPEANIQVVTGKGSGHLFVLDVDVDEKKGVDGLETLKDLEEEYGPLPETVMAKTPRGGTHYYFKVVGRSIPKNSVGTLGSGIDTRSEGGYVLAPPSDHPLHGEYTWINSPETTEIATLPKAWRAALETHRVERKSPVTAMASSGDGTELVVPQGERNATLASWAGKHVKSFPWISEEGLAEHLLIMNKDSMDPPLSEQEVRTVAGSVHKYSPGGAPFDPNVEYTAEFAYGRHTYRFPYHDGVGFGITVLVERFEQQRGGDLVAYLTISGDQSAHPQLVKPRILFAKQNLASLTTRKTLCNKLEETLSLNGGWNTIIETVCEVSIKKRWEGDPIVPIGQLPKRVETHYLLWPLIREGSLTILYGPGGAGKSYLSLYIAFLIQYDLSCGTTITASKPKNCLYLDWESNSEDLNERLRALAKGHSYSDVALHYRRSHIPLVQDINTIQQIVVDNDIGFIIVDSKSASIGGKINEADATQELYNAVRSLNCTVLVVDHVAKQDSIGPIGSVVNTNQARDMWEIIPNEISTSPKTIRVGLHHKKTNTGMKHDPIGLEISFEDDVEDIIDRVHITPIEIREDPEQLSRLSIEIQVRHFLKQQDIPQTFEEIHQGVTDVLGNPYKANLVRNRLENMKLLDKPGWWTLEGTSYVYLPNSGGF